jgi:hypothetical protein
MADRVIVALARRRPEVVAAASFVVFGTINVTAARLCRPLQASARPKERENFPWALASRCTAVLHAVAITAMGVSAFRSAGTGLGKLLWTGSHGPSELACMAFSFGFFVQDFIYMLVKEWDHVFVLHHILVMLFLISSRLSGRAGRVCVAGLAMGEITNPLQNGFWAVRALGMERAQAVVLPLFTIAYGVVRLVLSPYVSWLIIRECLATRNVVNYMFSVLGLCLNGGSAIWAWGLARYNLRFWGVIGDRSGVKNAEKAAAGGSKPVELGDHPMREHRAACKAEMARTAAATADVLALESHLAKHEETLLAARAGKTSTHI